ncbi:MAG: transcriptional activator NhaR [Gammaproteobacteria bacterium]|nr:transcriptional activator NhaR [Gammaproteobacteria bacterium]
MRHLNYNHLLYFWTVAREGSIARAAELLHLTPQTISGQLKMLEESIGEPLFVRVGRGLAITDTGQIVNQYADEIFTLGAELTQRVRSKRPGMPSVFNVGIVDSIPKLIAHRALRPVLELDDPVRIVCAEGDLERLLGDLAVHRVDLVISDRVIPPGLNVKAYNHAIGESGVAFFGHKSIAARYTKRFPTSLNDAPVLLPVNTSALRRSLDDWFDRVGVTPHVVAEFADSALLKAFGDSGGGLFPAPTAITDQVEHMYDARLIGQVDDIHEKYYAISPERRLKHPAVLRIIETARSRLTG